MDVAISDPPRYDGYYCPFNLFLKYPKIYFGIFEKLVFI